MRELLAIAEAEQVQPQNRFNKSRSNNLQRKGNRRKYISGIKWSG